MLDDWDLVSDRERIFFFITTSRPALGSTHPPIQWVLAALCLGVKQLGDEADHSPSSSTKVKES